MNRLTRLVLKRPVTTLLAVLALVVFGFSSLTTIYRYLDRLEKDGTVIRYVSGQGSQAAYQYVEQGKGCCDHLHLQCVKCGRIYHLDCAFMKEISEHIEKDHGFELQCRNSVLYGICKDCKTMKA